MPTRHLFAALIAGGMLILGGCVTSHSARYQQHLGAIVKPAPHANHEVAAAFGLFQPAAAPVAAGALREH